MDLGFTWRDDSQTKDAQCVGEMFRTQVDAEAWLSEVYEELLERGIKSVSLYNEDGLVYGPMPLTQ